MKKYLLWAVLAIGCINCTTAKNLTQLANGEVIPLYDGKAPGTESWNHQEYQLGDEGMVFNVTNPSMTVYLPSPEKRNGKAMLVCPGGGMCMLSMISEGDKVAKVLVEQGITAFVLKYRTTPMLNEKGENLTDMGQAIGGMLKYVHDVKSNLEKEGRDSQSVSIWCAEMPSAKFAFADATRAMEIIRSHMSDWGIDKVGIMGFSAGAITTTYVALNHTETSRPDFVAVIYGGWVDPAVPSDAAPLFIASPVNDLFSPEESFNLLKAWREKKIPVEYHMYSTAEHGFGANITGKSSDDWMNTMFRFMKDVNFLAK